ncbi:MAG: DUF4402 domain-containing protein [Novosphingobium sp.]|jgi:hypothetical protein|nr:DUF4402 domain-containing protein [Novosphingobium sp.]
MLRPLALTLSMLLAAPATGQDGCRLCYSDVAGKPGERPLALEIFTDLNFARLALAGRDGGSAEVDAASGSKRTGGGVVNLGGMPVTGRGRVTGEPLREVRIVLPSTVPMTAPDGGSAELTGFTTDLPGRPTLDANGELTFSFGARLVLRGARGGNYRGRIPITVEYN